MTRDRDISLGEIDAVSVDDSRRPRRPAGTQSGGNQPPPRKNNGPAPKRPVPSKPKTGGGWMLATIVLAMVVLVAGAWLWRELTHMRAQLDAQLEASQQRLGNLASQLSATDESLNQSSGKVRDTLDTHASEIRKLWDVSNKRNRDWIQENKTALRKLDDQRVELAKLVAGLQTRLDSLRSQQERAGVQRNQQQTQLDLLNESVNQVEQRVAQQQKLIKDLNALLPQLEALVAVNRQGDGIGKRLGEIEAAIAAFDAYRRQVNNRLDRIDSPGP